MASHALTPSRRGFLGLFAAAVPAVAVARTAVSVPAPQQREKSYIEICEDVVRRCEEKVASRPFRNGHPLLKLEHRPMDCDLRDTCTAQCGIECAVAPERLSWWREELETQRAKALAAA